LFAAAVLLIGYLCIDPGLRFSDTVLDKFEQFTSQGQTQSQLGNFSGRNEMWEKIWDSYLQSPLIGHGYFVSSATGRLLVWDEWGNWTAHNLWLQCLVTLGVVGLLLFTIGIGCVAWPVLRKLGSRDRSQHRLALLLTLIGVWFLGWGTLNESVFGPLAPESVMFALTLGLGAALANQASSSRTDDSASGELREVT
jgi:O-antigen ligase